MKRTILVLCAFLFAGVARAQDPTTGFPPYGSFENGRFDAVNRQNVNVNFSVPIVSLPGRGMDFNFALVYDSLIWTKATSGSTTTWASVTDANGNPTWGWKTGSRAGTTKYRATTWRCRYMTPDGLIVWETTTMYWNYVYIDQLGTSHSFPVTFMRDATDCGYATDPRTGYANDGSGYYLDASWPTVPLVTAPAGIKSPSATQATDTNGNSISATVVSQTETDWKDTANHTALRVITGSSTTEYHYLDTGNTDRVITLNLQSFSVKTNFGCAGVVEYTGTPSLPTSLSLPNGQQYQFTYEDTPGFTGYKTGRLKRVTLPTGGYYEYQYPASPNNGISCSDAGVNSLTRVINDGSTSTTWVFSRSGGTTTETAPQLSYDTAANQTVFTFDSNGHLTGQQIYQGSASPSNVKRTINTTWATNGTPATQTVILEDATTQSQTETTFDSNGNLQILKEHDWGTGSPGAVVRTTTLSYLSTSAYTALNIVNRVTNKTVYQGDTTGTVKSRTDITYDGYDTTHPMTCQTTPIAQHDDTNYGCSFTTRGNATSVAVYTDPVTPAGGITKYTSYDQLGNVVKADVNCCQQEQWSYSATTNYAYADSVVRGPSGNQLTSSATYNSYTGLGASTTDENNQPTNFSYDLMKRLVDVQRPDSAHLTWSYTDATPPAQSSVTVTTPVQGTNVQKQTITYDGLGRPVKTTVKDGSQTSYSITEAQYDSWGRAYKVSNPHNSTAQYWTETDFDALGRPTKTILPDNAQTTYAYATNTVTVTDPAGKQRKSQADGLGRLASVWEPDVANGNQLTQQASYTYTVLNALAQVTQGVQTRTYNYDALGRLSSAATPETNNQAVSYQYNSFNLVTQRTDVRGVITTYSYDPLNRLQQISYNVGTTGVPATPAVSFTYGSSAAQNNNGRLLTMTDGVGSETYSYDVLGRTTQVQKVISGTTYTTVYAYNAASELTSITYPSGRVVQPSYDTIGRLSTVASGSTNYASGFTYNPAFQVTGFNYGNAVAASFGFSPDRLQLSSLSYVKGAQTLFGLNYWYKQDSTNCAGGATGNNGQIQCIQDTTGAGSVPIPVEK